MTNPFGMALKSELESIRRSLNEPTPDIKVLNIKLDALQEMVDIYLNRYEELVWENAKLRIEESERLAATK